MSINFNDVMVSRNSYVDVALPVAPRATAHHCAPRRIACGCKACHAQAAQATPPLPPLSQREPGAQMSRAEKTTLFQRALLEYDGLTRFR